MSFLRNDTDDRSAFAIGLCRCVGAEPLYAVLFPFALLWGVLEAVRYAKSKPPLLFKRFSIALWAAWFLSALIFGVWRNFA